MSGPSARMRAVLLAAILATAAGVVGAGPAVAAEPSFQKATATVSFLEAIELSQRVTVPDGVERVEAIVRAGGDARTFLATIPTPSPGDTTLRYSHATPPGALFPNTLVELGFRLTLDDGRFVDGPTTTVRYADDRFDWRTLSGSIVRVHWYRGDAGFGQRALDIGERAVEEASALLGVEERLPVDFFIYADRDAFYDVIGPGIQENVGGLALASIRTLFANIAPSSVTDPWVRIVVPHELTHLVFDSATRNRYHEPVHWLNEGLADYLAGGCDAGARANVDRAARSGELMPLHALIGQFPSEASRFSLAYDESVCAIDYLVRAHGQPALVALIRGYADGVSDDETFMAALGVDTAGFEAAWLADLGVDPPQPHGPRPAPAGPVPPGWVVGPGQTAGPGGPGPLPTREPSGAPGPGDIGGAIVLGTLIALGVTLVAGLVVTARRLGRGEPLLAGPGAAAGTDAADGSEADADGEGDSR